MPPVSTLALSRLRPPCRGSRYDQVVSLKDMQLTQQVSKAAYEAAFESWSFLDFSGKRPLMASLFGDVFLRTPDGVWWFDVRAGTLSRVWGTSRGWQAELATSEGREKYLLARLAEEADQAGLTLGSEEVYAFRTPLVLGGDFDVSNLAVRDFAAAVNLAGQVHCQARVLRPGTAIHAAVVGRPRGQSSGRTTR